MTDYGSPFGLASVKARGTSLVLLLFLTACATPKPQIPAAPLPAPTMAPPPVSASTPGMTANAMLEMPVGPMMMAPPPPPTDAPSLRAAYGAPDFVRREADAELWRYNGTNCSAFFFLYRDGEAWRLRYTETVPRGQDTPADPACISGLTARAMS
jgi:hypothetical protein